MGSRSEALSPLRVAMIGQKGYPPVHGGIERHVAELAARLPDHGVEVDIYSRPHYSDADGPTTREGVGVRRRPSIPTKHLDAISHTVVCTVDALFQRYDVVHYHALGPGLLAGLPRLLGRVRTVTTVHGLDWQREKWGRFARGVLRIGETASVKLPDRTIVVSRALAAHYRQEHGHETTPIPNGIDVPRRREPDLIRGLGVRDGCLLFVGRLVPEKGCHDLIEAYRRLPAETRQRHQLVIAGGAGFTDAYETDLRRRAGDDVLFTGFIHGQVLEELWSNAALVVLPSTLEGLSIALLEAMSYANCCLASDIPPNREAGGDTVAFAPASAPEDLAASMAALLADPDRRSALGEAAAARVRDGYSWETAVEATARVYHEACGRPFPV